MFTFFKFLCILATTVMVGFWLYKFMEDHDVTLIEYKELDDLDEFIYPETTLCFYNAFFPNEDFNITSTSKFYSKYSAYIKGKLKDVETYNDIKYDQISVDLEDHIKKITITWEAGKKPSDYLCKDVNDCPYYSITNNYNGFSNDGVLLKCFGIALKNPYANDITSMRLIFNSTLKNVIKRSASV